MGEDKALPAAREVVLGADGAQLNARAGRKGLQKQVHLGIVAQGLEVPHTLHGLCDGLLIDYAALAELNVQAEAVRNDAL